MKVEGRFMKRTLILMFIFLVLFTIACLVVTAVTGTEPGILEGSVFAFCGAEGGLSAWIKVVKHKTKKEE